MSLFLATVVTSLFFWGRSIGLSPTSIITMELTANSERPPTFSPQIITWLFDGSKPENVAYAHSANKVLINRIGNLVAIDKLNQILQGE